MMTYYISPKSRRELAETMKEFANKSKIGVAEAVSIIGSNVARQLAIGMQPTGMNSKVGAKFSVGIVRQVQKAARHAQYKGDEMPIADVHTKYRNKNGAVMVFHPPKFQPKSRKIPKQDVGKQARLKIREMGKAKAGWIAAGESIDSPLLKTKRGKNKRLSGVSYWIRRHVSMSVGRSKFVKRLGLNSGVYLTNEVGYAYASGSPNHRQVNKSIKTGYLRSITKIKNMIKKLK